MIDKKRFTIGVLLTLCATLFHQQGTAQTSGPLYEEIAHQDSLLFAAFNQRDLAGMMMYFDPSLEWYQDNTGVKNFEQTQAAFGGLFKMNYVLTRKLIPGTMEVYPIRDFGAIETGKHTFSHTENGQLVVGTFAFLQIWQKKEGVWRVTREVSYAH